MMKKFNIYEKFSALLDANMLPDLSSSFSFTKIYTHIFSNGKVAKTSDRMKSCRKKVCHFLVLPYKKHSCDVFFLLMVQFRRAGDDDVVVN